MKFLKLANKNRESAPDSYNAYYESEVVKKIRAKYSVSQELAILRQRDSKPAEFAEYNSYVEQCKSEVKIVLFGT